MWKILTILLKKTLKKPAESGDDANFAMLEEGKNSTVLAGPWSIFVLTELGSAAKWNKLCFPARGRSFPEERIRAGAANPPWEKEIETCCKVLMWLW